MENEAPNAEPVLPVCPYCNQDPVNISWRNIQLGPIQALMIFCGNADCRKMFAVEAIGMNQQAIAQQRPRILTPS